MITNTKKQRLKIYSKVWIFKYIILNKQTNKKNKVTKIIKYIYMKFALKNRVSFFAK